MASSLNHLHRTLRLTLRLLHIRPPPLPLTPLRRPARPVPPLQHQHRGGQGSDASPHSERRPGSDGVDDHLDDSDAASADEAAREVVDGGGGRRGAREQVDDERGVEREDRVRCV